MGSVFTVPSQLIKGCPNLEVYLCVQYDLTRHKALGSTLSIKQSSQEAPLLPAWLPSSWTQEQEAYSHLIQLPGCPPLSSSPPRSHVLSNLPTPETSDTSSKSLPHPGPDQLQWPLCCPSQPLLVWSLHNCQKKLLRSYVPLSCSPSCRPFTVPYCFSVRMPDQQCT